MVDDGHPDALPTGAVRGRGAGLNPGNRFEDRRLHVLGDHLDEVRAEHPDGVQVATTVLPDATRRVINRVESPDLPFHWTINPYRGCEHGCPYCYARPTHEMLGLSCGLDFETRIVAKHDAPGLLRTELSRRAWAGEPIAMSGVTDAYQPVERKLEIARGCLEVMAECAQPVGIVTKNRLVTRDLDLLASLARDGAAHVWISLTTLDATLASSMEPRASAPRDRLRAMRELADANIPVGVMVAPVIPALTDHELPQLLEAAADHGATAGGWVLLRLPYQVRDLFLEWLRRAAPDRAGHVESAIRDTRDGALSDSRFGARMKGDGPRARQIAETFRVFTTRFGLDRRPAPLSSAAFRRPRSVTERAQLDLFPGGDAC